MTNKWRNQTNLTSEPFTFSDEIDCKVSKAKRAFLRSVSKLCPCHLCVSGGVKPPLFYHVTGFLQALCFSGPVAHCQSHVASKAVLCRTVVGIVLLLCYFQRFFFLWPHVFVLSVPLTHSSYLMEQKYML